LNEPRVSAAFFFGFHRLLAGRTNAEKFKLVGYPFETVCRRNAFFNLVRETFLNLNHFRTTGANQMMVMAVLPFSHQFKPRRPVAKIKPLDHPHLFQQVHRPVNRRQIALSPGQSGQNIPARERMRVLPENLQDGRARASDLSRLLAQTARQRGQFLSPM
jgi:hypothetical protein